MVDWLPDGPSEFFRRCDACDTPWGLAWESFHLEAAELPDAVAALLVESPAAEEVIKVALDSHDGPVLTRCVATLARSRFESGGDPALDVAAIIGWLGGGRDGTETVRALEYLGIALGRAVGHEDVEAAQVHAMRDAFAARIDEGRGLEEAAELARRDSTRGRTLMSLPTLRNLDVMPLVALLAKPPACATDYGAGQLVASIRRLLHSIATAARRPPKLTVTTESRHALERIFPSG